MTEHFILNRCRKNSASYTRRMGLERATIRRWKSTRHCTHVSVEDPEVSGPTWPRRCSTGTRSGHGVWTTIRTPRIEWFQGHKINVTTTASNPTLN